MKDLDCRHFVLVSALILCSVLCESSCFAQWSPVTIPDNALTTASHVGLPPEVAREGDSEVVNLNSGSLNLFIPAVTLPQRSGSPPLVLGFTYESNQQRLSLEVSDSPQEISAAIAGGSWPDGCSTLCWRDNYSYTAQVIDATTGGKPFSVNIPYLRASIEYIENSQRSHGDVDVNDGADYDVNPDYCVTNFTFTDWSGATHAFAGNFSCSDLTGTQNLINISTLADSSDGSLLRLDVSNWGDIKVTDPDGTVYHFTNLQDPFPNSTKTFYGSVISKDRAYLAVPTSIVDRNGSTITISGQSDPNLGDITGELLITDTLGRQIKVRPNDGIYYTDSNGQSQSVQINAANASPGPSTSWIQSVGPSQDLTTNCSASNPGPPAPYYDLTISAPTGLVDATVPFNATISYSGTGKQFTFQFDRYFHLVKVIYPTGGYTRFDYGLASYSTSQGVQGAISCNWGVARVTKRSRCSDPGSSCSEEAVTTYSAGDAVEARCPIHESGENVLQLAYLSLTVTDPNGRKTIHCYDGLHSAPSVTYSPQVETDTYIIASDGTEMEHIHRDGQLYEGQLYPNIHPSKVTTTIDSGSKTSVTSYIKYQYDTAPNQLWTGNIVFPPLWAGTEIKTSELRDAPTRVDEYGYDSSLIRSTTHTYYHSGHILDRLANTTTDDPVNSLESVESYGFASDGKGNINSITRSGTNTLSYKTTYSELDGYGRPTKVTDSRGNQTVYSYADSWSDSTAAGCPSSGSGYQAYLTSITDALSETTSYTYNPCTGTLASTTDANGTTTSYQYDSLGRITHQQATGKDQSIASSVDFSYQDTGQNLVKKTVHADPNPNVITESIFDGLGRPIDEVLAGSIHTAKGYDDLDRLCAQANPSETAPLTTGLSCSSADNSIPAKTDGITYFAYDDLDRKTQQIGPYGTQQWQYSANVVDYYDELNHQWERTYDAAGRLTKVLEPDSSNKPTIETDYQYDGLNNLVEVDQWGGAKNSVGVRSRSFTYDGLSRLITASNPEAGTSKYSYSKDSSVCASVSSLPCSKTDARNITTYYTYDALNRLTAKSYGSDPNGTPFSCYQYGVSQSDGTNAIGRMINSWTERKACDASPGSSYVTLRSFLAYDAVGRLISEKQCTTSGCRSAVPCQTASGASASYGYDLAGHLTCSGNGVPSTPGAGSDPVMFSSTFDSAGRLKTFSSNWSDTSHPGTIFAPTTTGSGMCGDSSSTQYAPFGGLLNASFGKGMVLNRSYDRALRLTCEVDNATN